MCIDFYSISCIKSLAFRHVLFILSMGKAKNIAREKVAQIAQIVALSNEGLTQAQICTRFNVGQSVISRALKTYKETGSFSHKKSPGAPRCTSIQTDWMIKRMVVSSPSCSSSAIQSQLPPQVSVSTRTIRRRLQVDFQLPAQLPAYHPACKQKLSAKNVHGRIFFCQKYKGWTAEQWATVMFTDETMIKQFYAYSSHVRRPLGKRYDQRYTTPRVKNSPSVMIWGSISSQGAGDLWFMPTNTTINAAAQLPLLSARWRSLPFCKDG